TWSKIDRDTVIEYSFKQNDKNHHLQFIVLLQDDSLSKRVGEIIASYNNNKSIVLQFDARSSEARIAYGTQNN
ncbi:C80 family cysteine peptidase, partial [Yersinia pestis]